MADAKTLDLQKQYDLIHDIISKKLESQISSLSSIDTKSGIFLAVIGVIFSGYLQMLTSEKFKFYEYKYFVIFELLLFILAGYYSFRAFILKNNDSERWFDNPRPKKLLDVFSQNSDKGVYWLKDEINKSMSGAYEQNDILFRKKYKFFLRARDFLFALVILISIHLLFLLFGLDKFIIPLK